MYTKPWQKKNKVFHSLVLFMPFFMMTIGVCGFCFGAVEENQTSSDTTVKKLREQYLDLSRDAQAIESQNNDIRSKIDQSEGLDPRFPHKILMLELLDLIGGREFYYRMFHIKWFLLPIGYVLFIFWRRREIAYLFSKASFARTFWLGREEPAPMPRSLIEPYRRYNHCIRQVPQLK